MMYYPQKQTNLVADYMLSACDKLFISVIHDKKILLKRLNVMESQISRFVFMMNSRIKNLYDCSLQHLIRKVQIQNKISQIHSI